MLFSFFPLALAAVLVMDATPALAQSPHPAAPQAQAPLTLAAATALALRSNPELRAAANELAAHEGALVQAGALPNPELDVLREGRRRESRTTTAQLAIPLELGGKRAARTAAADKQRALAVLELEVLRVRIQADVAAAFHEVAAAAGRHRTALELAALAGQVLDAATRRAQAGKSSPVEVTRARMAQAGARIDAVQAARDLEGARLRLGALWGGDGHGFEIVAPATPALPSAPPLERLAAQLDQSPAMALARAQVGHREALARVEQSRRVPDLTLIVGARREGIDDRSEAVVGLSMPIPVFNSNKGAVLEALRRADKARDERDAQQVRLQSELGQAHGRLRAALEEAVLISGEILPGAEQACQAARRGFELGKFSISDVFEAQRTLFQSKIQYLNAVADSHRAAADIARLTGMPAFLESQ